MATLLQILVYLLCVLVGMSQLFKTAEARDTGIGVLFAMLIACLVPYVNLFYLVLLFMFPHKRASERTDKCADF